MSEYIEVKIDDGSFFLIKKRSVASMIKTNSETKVYIENGYCINLDKQLYEKIKEGLLIK